MTATIGCIPHRLFDGAWTNEKRDALRDAFWRGSKTSCPERGARSRLRTDRAARHRRRARRTEGDLDGGEIAPDQMFGWRGFADIPAAARRSRGLYLGGRRRLRARSAPAPPASPPRARSWPIGAGVVSMSGARRDAIVIGGGIGGLVAATYLAKAGPQRPAAGSGRGARRPLPRGDIARRRSRISGRCICSTRSIRASYPNSGSCGAA